MGSINNLQTYRRKNMITNMEWGKLASPQLQCGKPENHSFNKYPFHSYKHQTCCQVFRNTSQFFGHVRLFVTPWTVALQGPLSMGILQARILEWVAMPSPRGSSQPKVSIGDNKCAKCIFPNRNITTYAKGQQTLFLTGGITYFCFYEFSKF